MAAAERYPLSWPNGWKRTEPYKRREGRFRSKRASGGQASITLSDALDRLVEELRKLKATEEILSTNVRVGIRGWPVGQAEPSDSGVAVYFQLNKKPRVLACDLYRRVADNIAAISAHIECIRGIDRYGVGTMEQAFAGYAALPAQGETSKPGWTSVLNLTRHATKDEVLSRHRLLVKLVHPDVGGSHEAMTALNVARDEALAELSR